MRVDEKDCEFETLCPRRILIGNAIRIADRIYKNVERSRRPGIDDRQRY